MRPSFAAVLLGAALMAPATATQADPVREVTYMAGQPAMNVGTAFYSSLQQSAHLTERYAGVTVKIQPTAGGIASMQGVATGSGLYAWGGLLGFLDLARRTPNIVMISFDPKNPYRIWVLPDSPLAKAEDLRGKKIGLQSLGASNYAIVVAELSMAKLGRHDATLISVGVGATAADALRTGKIDGYAGKDGTIPVIEMLLKTKLKVIQSPINDLPGMNGIVVSRYAIQKDPHIVAGLCKAFYASLVFAKGNPRAAVINHWNTYPSQAPAGNKDQVIADSITMLQARLDVDAQPGVDGLYGYQPLPVMQKVLQTLHDNGALEGDVPDLGKYVDLRFAKECGTIDAAALEQEAKNWVPPGPTQ
jgi:NitT/TauT family transport system substrate-binding protein